MKRIKDVKWGIYLAVLMIAGILTVWSADFDAVCKYEKDVYYRGQIALTAADGTLEQEFVCEQDTLAGIDLYFISGAASSGDIVHAELYSEGVLAAEWEIFGTEIRSETYNHFFLPEKLQGTAGKTFRLVLRSNAEDRASCLRIGSALSDEKLEETDLFGGVLKEQVVCVRNFYKYISKNTVLLFMVLATVCIWGVSVFAGVRKMRQERRFLLLGTVLGLFFLILIPYSQVPDESRHFLRIFEITEGHLISDQRNGVGGRELPSMPYVRPSISGVEYSDIWSVIGAKVHYDKPEWQIFPNTALYAPVSYLPQAVGMFLGKLVSDTVFGITFMGKLFAMLSSLAMVYLSIKLIPVKKLSLVLIALMPMFLQESVSLAADCLINSLSMLMVAHALYLAYNDKELLSKKDYAFLYLGVLFVALCKIVYLPLCAIYFIIPREKFGNARKFAAVLGGAMLLAIFGNLVWLTISSGYLMEFQPGVDSAAQVRYVFGHPFAFVQAVYRTVMNYGAHWGFGVLGNALGWMNIGVSQTALLLYMFLLVMLSAVAEKDGPKIRKKDRYVAGGICLAVTALIFGSLYVQWTAVGADVVEGIQGRYFIPVVILLATMFGTNKILDQTEQKEKYVYPFIGWVEVVALVSIVQTMV